MIYEVQIADNTKKEKESTQKINDSILELKTFQKI